MFHFLGLSVGSNVGGIFTYLGGGIKDQVPFVGTKELPKYHLLVEALH